MEKRQCTGSKGGWWLPDRALEAMEDGGCLIVYWEHGRVVTA